MQDGFGIHAVVGKQAVRVVKNCGDDVLEKMTIECWDRTALDKEAA